MRGKFSTVIFATAFKFHVGSVLLIDLVSSVPLGRPRKGSGEAEGEEMGGPTSRASQPVSHYIIPLSYCRAAFAPLI